MTVEDYQTISDSIDAIDSDAELLDCLGFLQKLSMVCVNKMFYNLPKRKFQLRNKKKVLVKKRERWYSLANYFASLEARLTLYKNGK